jgi:hypothetical protein
MKTSLYFFFLILVIACNSNNKTASLPELPEYEINNLDSLKGFTGLVTKRSVFNDSLFSKVSVKSSNLLQPIDCSEINDYLVQVTYPITICENIFFNESVFNVSNTAKTKEFKLTKFKNKVFAKPWFCRIHGGPWMMKIRETHNCGANINIKLYDATIIGVKSYISFSWAGTMLDYPDKANLHLIGQPYLQGSFRTPCGRNVNCN